MKKHLLIILSIVAWCTSANGQVTLFAGSGSSLGDGGMATSALLSNTQGICSDYGGNVYIMQAGGGRVRKITPAGIIYTVVGYGATGFSGDGGPASAAKFDAYGLSCDLYGNLYIGDWNNNRVRKVDAATGIITTIAGNGSGTSSGDGGAATAASLDSPISAASDSRGNVFISEYGSGKIRRIDGATGIITTTATGIAGASQIVTDINGNVYVAAKTRGRIYKIDTSGSLTLIAGGGSTAGSGVPATSVSLGAPEGVAVDSAGNVFIDDGAHIKMVDTSGTITDIVVAGNQWLALDVYGTLFFTTGGGSAYKMPYASPYGIGFPAIGAQTVCAGDSTLYRYAPGVWSSSPTSIATIDSFTGKAIGLTAGAATISFTSSCCGTITSSITVNPYCSGTPVSGSAAIAPGDSCVSPDTLILTGYTTNCGISLQWQNSTDGIRWANVASAVSSSFPIARAYSTRYYRCAVTCSSGATTYSSAVLAPSASSVSLHTVSNPHDTVCNGARFFVSTCTSPASYFYTRTWYGDGSTDTALLSTTGTPHATIVHHYAYPGNYTIRQVIFDDTLAVDSISFSYEYLYCSTLPVKFYYDGDSNCTFDPYENYLSVPVSVQVDSNGTIIDTVSATSGFYYQTLGGPGTIYTFKLLNDSEWTTCADSGIVRDTIDSYVNDYPAKYIGLRPFPSSFNLSVHPVMAGTGRHQQVGNIYVQNNRGVSEHAWVKFIFDRRFSISASRTPIITGDTASWTIDSVSATARSPHVIHFQLEAVSAWLPLREEVRGNFLTGPVVGDFDPSNNVCTRNDTVKSGYDPNFIENMPSGCLPLTTGITQLQYTVHFENTGNDTAHNIYVLDTLSPNLNPHSLKVLMASATMNISIINDGGFNVVKFDFPQINLLDSSHHGLCDGAVIYTINTLPSLPLGATVEGRAGIYFDVNEVVLTNTCENVIGCPETSVSEVVGDGSFSVYPNPVLDELTIVANSRLYNNAIITNSVGRVMAEKQLTSHTTKVSTARLPSGLYYIRLSGENGIFKVGKFVKL